VRPEVPKELEVVLTVQRYTGLEDCLGYHRKPPTERGGAL